MEDCPLDAIPPTLLDLLLNPIISDSLYQYLPRAAVFRLILVGRKYRQVILNTPGVFRYLDLSNCKGAYTPNIAPLDNGGNSWRAERIDDNLSYDEFCSASLRFVFNRLDKLKVLRDVQTLVLDGLGSVTPEILYEIITSDRFNVRLLSIRKCPNINQSRLQHLLAFICRPTRPEGTPRLKGLYFFTDPAHDTYPNTQSDTSTTSVTASDGATLGLLPSDKTRDFADNAQRWYSPSGRVVSVGADVRSSWEETLQTCRGIIAFDAVLCHAMHEHMEPVLHEASRDFLTNSKPGVATLATIALGPDGCSGCGNAPKGTATWGHSELYDFPLLSPAPRSGKLLDALRPPKSSSMAENRLIVSCKWCLVNRHCDSCHRWWCADCYDPKQTNKLKNLERLSNAGLLYLPTEEELVLPSSSGSDTQSIKDHDRSHHYLPAPSNKAVVTRPCWDCGRVCAPCASRSNRICKRCKGAYCFWHNTGCDESHCDWCQYRGGNTRLRELY